MIQDNKLLISETFDWYLREILPIVSHNAIQQKYGYHGLYTHTSAVVFRGIDYATSLNQDPRIVALACAFHDMARTNDGPDMMHAENAVPIAQRIIDKCLPLFPTEKQSVIYAVRNHTIGKVAPDFVSACLWDADRTRLSWECGFNPMFFTTERAKQIASENPEKYLQFMHKCMSEYAHKTVKVLDKQY